MCRVEVGTRIVLRFLVVALIGRWKPALRCPCDKYPDESMTCSMVLAVARSRKKIKISQRNYIMSGELIKLS